MLANELFPGFNFWQLLTGSVVKHGGLNTRTSIFTPFQIFPTKMNIKNEKSIKLEEEIMF